MKCKHWSEEQMKRVCVPVRCVETRQVFLGVKDAERKTGIGHSHISNCCKGRAKTAGGFHWEYG